MSATSVLRWRELAAAEPELADFGARRLRSGPAYLATVDRRGAPRLHPVTPLFRAGGLYLFMEPDSPKGHDLVRDGRFALHALVEDSGGGGGEFLARGLARRIEDAATRARVATADTPERHVLFELLLGGALSTVYEGERIVRVRWEAP